MQKEFSYPLKIDELGQGEQTCNLRADKEQLATLKEILKVPAVNSFEANLKLKFQKKRGLLEINGTANANLELISVISLEAFNKDYTAEFKLMYDTNATYEDIYGEDDDIENDVPDIVYDGKIDLGDIAIEQVALIMEDHPRKDGEEFDAVIEDNEPVKNNPFAALAKLKK
ncbi:MAG: DUF177 domain-containing protein [Alphaproteobacteria bacterium]|nr:DUF177 domain-containing protein [Alphaproteobacteria bacterium]